MAFTMTHNPYFKGDPAHCVAAARAAKLVPLFVGQITGIPPCPVAQLALLLGR
jgi:hypothetical protein